MDVNPNFPPNLDIRPSYNYHRGNQDHFDTSSQEDAIRTYGIAGRVWEAAYAMLSYLEHSSGPIFDPPFLQPYDFPPHHILELGSGTGIVASRLAENIKHTQGTLTVTDLPEVCPLLERNLATFAQNASSKLTVLVRPLSWGNKQHALDIYEELRSHTDNIGDPTPLTHIICSDLVYFPELLAPLLRTLLHLTSPPFTSDPSTSPTVTISYKVRSLAKETPFWSAFGLWFSFEPVLERRLRNSQKSGPFRQGSRNSPLDPALERQAPPVLVPSDQEGGRDDGEWQRFGAALDEDMFIFVARRRTESVGWVVPESDEELLGGVGARGTQPRKSDDTFESILLLKVGESGL